MKSINYIGAPRNFFLLYVFCNAFCLSAEPVTVGNIPLQPGAYYNLELSRDEGFARVVVKKIIRSAPLNFDLTQEGVYHWRLLAFSNTPKEEKSTMASGSFVYLPALENPKKNETAFISWNPEAEATAYQVVFFHPNGMKQSSVNANKPEILIARTKNSYIVSIEAFKNNEKLYEGLYILKGLSVSSEKPQVVEIPKVAKTKKLAKKAVLQPKAVTKSDSAPTLQKVDAKFSVEEKLAVDEVRDISTAHQLIFYEALYLEKLKLNKSTQEISGDTQSVGLGLKFFSTPALGLFFGAGFDYHDYKTMGSHRVDNEAKTKRYMKGSRYNLDFLAGWNLLNLFGNKRHFFGPFVSGSYIQIPQLPTVTGTFDFLEDQLPTENYFLGGGGLSYRYFTNRFGLLIQGQTQVTEKKDGQIDQGGLAIEFYLPSQIALQLGFWTRQLDIETCAEVADVCLDEGKVSTESSEIYATLGVGVMR
ncbi:MAG: hypothetical protein KBD78_06150 [Oligoflexales bacterium]|nr:hypothetical protein [Oligoflexales bacterium]